MKSPINIVILTPGFAKNESDTTAIPSLQLYFSHLHEHYTDLSLNILTFQYPFNSGKYFWKGIPVFSAGGKNLKINRPLTWIRILVHLFKIHRKSKIDILHAYWLSEATLIGKVFSWISGVPLVSTAMGQDVKTSNKYLRILKFFRLNVILISEFQSNFVSPLKKMNVMKVIPFGIDASFFNAEATDRTTDIIGVGSLNRVKNYPCFIDVIYMTSTVFPQVSCTIVGEGLMRKSIEYLIAKRNLKDRILLSGSLSYPRTIEAMHTAKVLLHTSEFEGQALVITEALAAGLYVVSFPVGIAAGLTSPKLTTGNTAEELAEHVSTILQNPKPDFSPETPFKIEGTCLSNYVLYKSLINT